MTEEKTEKYSLFDTIEITAVMDNKEEKELILGRLYKFRAFLYEDELSGIDFYYENINVMYIDKGKAKTGCVAGHCKIITCRMVLTEKFLLDNTIIKKQLRRTIRKRRIVPNGI